MNTERLTIAQTATGYWVVQRGSVDVAGALTRKAAEAERELHERLRAGRAMRARTAPQTASMRPARMGSRRAPV